MWFPTADTSLVWVLLGTSSLHMAQQHSCQLHEAAARGSPACPSRCQLGDSRFSSADYLWLGIYFLATENLICLQILHPLPTCHFSCPYSSSPSSAFSQQPQPPPISSQPMCLSSLVPGSRHHLRCLSSLPVSRAKLGQM